MEGKETVGILSRVERRRPRHGPATDEADDDDDEAAPTTAMTTEMSSPLPPWNAKPSLRALTPNGESRAARSRAPAPSTPARAGLLGAAPDDGDGEAADVEVGMRPCSERALAREHSASEMRWGESGRYWVGRRGEEGGGDDDEAAADGLGGRPWPGGDGEAAEGACAVGEAGAATEGVGDDAREPVDEPEAEAEFDGGGRWNDEISSRSSSSKMLSVRPSVQSTTMSSVLTWIE